MSTATATPIEGMENKSLKANQTMIHGRIEKSIPMKNGDGRITTIKTPAPSEFDHPQTVGVRSNGSLGVVGDMVKIRCTVSGRVRPFEYTDKQTGAREKGENYDIFLHAVE